MPFARSFVVSSVSLSFFHAVKRVLCGNTSDSCVNYVNGNVISYRVDLLFESVPINTLIIDLTWANRTASYAVAECNDINMTVFMSPA